MQYRAVPSAVPCVYKTGWPCLGLHITPQPSTAQHITTQHSPSGNDHTNLAIEQWNVPQ